MLNSLRPRLNRRPFADDIFKCIFLNENVWISIRISLKFVPKGPINIIPALVQIMAWRRPGDKPLSEQMIIRLLTHICVTRPQWVMGTVSTRSSLLGDVIWCHGSVATVPIFHLLKYTWKCSCLMATALSSGPFYQHGLNLIQSWMSNHMHNSVPWNYLSIPKLQRLNRWSLGMGE